MTLGAYLPIVVMAVLATAFTATAMTLSRRYAPRRSTPEKGSPYESGLLTGSQLPNRFPVNFYMVAMLFVIFQVAIVFLFVWAVAFGSLGWYGVSAVGIFVGFVLSTLIYAIRRGVLDWSVKTLAEEPSRSKVD